MTVFPVGNAKPGADNNDMGSNSPTRHANPNNPLIVVGAVDKNGRPSGFNKPIRPQPGAIGRDRQLTGEHTVFAMGENIDMVTTNEQSGYGKASGTSFATPQIAGLAAYLLTLPGLVWPIGYVSKSVKDHIVINKRKAPESPDGSGVAYNGIQYILRCQNDASNPGKLRRWYTDYTAVPNYLTLVIKRQKSSKGKEITIFKDGRLTDQKYSNEVCRSRIYRRFDEGLGIGEVYANSLSRIHSSGARYPVVQSGKHPHRPVHRRNPQLNHRRRRPFQPSLLRLQHHQKKRLTLLLPRNLTATRKTRTKREQRTSNSPTLKHSSKSPAKPRKNTRLRFLVSLTTLIDYSSLKSAMVIQKRTTNLLLKMRASPLSPELSVNVRSSSHSFSVPLPFPPLLGNPPTPFNQQATNSHPTGPTEENDRTYGGHVRISTTPFVVTAGKMEFEIKDIKCYTNDDKSSPDWLKPRYYRDEARKAINDVCTETGKWEVNHMETAPWDHVTPLYTFTVELKNGKTYLGFDRELCKKVFEGIVDKCKLSHLCFGVCCGLRRTLVN